MPADMQVLVRHIRRMASRGRFAKDSDRLLLESFVRDGNQDAFATVVARHAALVAGISRRVLGNAQDIEDVFQATFLVLARKAGTVRWHDSVANWLHSVAHRLALRARADLVRRQALQQAASAQAIAAEPPQQTREIQLILDAELDSLPEPERLPLILCYLEGRTRDEAARQCGWSLRTLERRLEQGRNLLRDRLVRRGLDLSVILLAAALSEQSGTANAQLTSATLMFLQATPAASGLCGDSVLRLAETALPIAGAGYLKLAAGLMLAIAVTGLGTYTWLTGTTTDSASPAHAGNEDPPLAQENKSPIQNAEREVVTDKLPPGAMRLGTERFRGSGFGQVQYSADGKRLISAGTNGIQVLDSTSGKNLLRLGVGLSFSQWSSAISADGKFAAFADSTGSKRGFVYDISTGRQVCELQTPANQKTRLACFSRDGSLLATLASQVQVDLYSTASGKLVRSLQWQEKYLPPDDYFSFPGEIGFLPDGKSLVVSIHATGTIRVFDVTTGKETRQITVSRNGMAGMTLSPDGSKLVTLPCVARQFRVTGFRDEPDESVQVWDAATGKQLGELLIPHVSKYWLMIGPDNKTLFAGRVKDGLGVWDLVTERNVGALPFPMSGPLGIAIGVSPDGKTFAFGKDSILHQIDIKTGKEAVAVDGHVGPISATAVSPTGSIVVTGGKDGKIILWDRSTGKQLRQFDESDGPVQQLLFGLDGSRLYALYQVVAPLQFGRGVAIRAFNLKDGKMVWQEPAFSTSTGIALGSSLAYHGDQLALLDTHSFVLLDASTGKIIKELGSPLNEQHAFWAPSTAVGYSDNGNRLFGWTRFLTLWRADLTSNKVIIQPCDESLPPTGSNEGLVAAITNWPRAAFSPDGKLLALGGLQPYLQLLSIETGKEMRRIARSDQENGPISNIAFAPDSRTVIWCGSNDGMVRMTDVAGGRGGRKLPALGFATTLAFSSDGKILAVGCDDGTAIVWDLEKLPAGN